jgi:DNA-binding GntR family transcriptional regulator
MLNERMAPSSLEEIASDARRTYTTIEDMVCVALRKAIITGVFLPGQRLRQELIAETFGVSRMPVRACLRILEAEGLVVFYPHRGATVRTISSSEVAEIYELRTILESYALGYVIERIADEEIDDIEMLANEMDSEQDPMKWYETRQLFYRQLYQIAGRPKLSELIAKLRLEITAYLMTVRVTDDHSELVECIRQRNKKTAIRWLEDHLKEISEQLQGIVNEERFNSGSA